MNAAWARLTVLLNALLNSLTHSSVLETLGLHIGHPF